MSAPVCPWCLAPVLPHERSSDDGQHLRCKGRPHKHAAELLDGSRKARSWQDEVIAGDEDLSAAISERCAATLDTLLQVLDFGNWAEVAA